MISLIIEMSSSLRGSSASFWFGASVSVCQFQVSKPTTAITEAESEWKKVEIMSTLYTDALRTIVV